MKIHELYMTIHGYTCLYMLLPVTLGFQNPSETGKQEPYIRIQQPYMHNKMFIISMYENSSSMYGSMYDSMYGSMYGNVC